MANDDNLKSWQPGQSGNPKGRPKGVKNLATIIRELEDDNFDWSKVPIKQKAAAEAVGSPWRAIVYTAVAKAYSGDVRAMQWLARAGYGDKVTHDFNDGLFQNTKIEVEIVKSTLQDVGDTESQLQDS